MEIAWQFYAYKYLFMETHLVVWQLYGVAKSLLLMVCFLAIPRFTVCFSAPCASFLSMWDAGGGVGGPEKTGDHAAEHTG